MSMSTNIAFTRAFVQLIHSIDYKLLFTWTIGSVLVASLTAMAYKMYNETESKCDEDKAIHPQYRDLSECNYERYIELHNRYYQLAERNHSRFDHLQQKYFNVMRTNQELMEKYGELVDTYREMGNSQTRIAEINQEMMRTYNRYAREYGYIASCFGYALRGQGQPAGIQGCGLA